MKHTFTHSDKGKTHILIQDESLIFLEDGVSSKKYKEFKSAQGALDYIDSEKIKFLKKGYIYRSIDAKYGELALQLYLGSIHTGLMPMAPVYGTNTFYLAYVLGEFDQENIWKIDERGVADLIIEMPPPSFTFDMAYDLASSKLYINANHNILFINSKDADALTRLSSIKKQTISTFSLAPGFIAWIDGEVLRVTNLQEDLVVWQTKLTLETHKLHTYNFCAGLSKDGSYLAYTSVDNDFINIVNLQNHQERQIAKKKDIVIRKLFFSPDNKELIIHESENSWQIRYLNLEEPFRWCRFPDIGEDAVLESSVDFEHYRLLVCTYKEVKVFDLISKEEIIKINPANTVKYCNAVFLRNYIAMYTDLGFVSLYKL